jgi:type I restriction-modification system DNA methylase subunit
MSKITLYTCNICNSKPDQISHHKSHIETQKHKDKKELFELKLGKLTKEELIEKYDEDNIDDIIKNMETNEIKKLNDELNNDKLMNTLMEDTNIISNRDALRDKIHEIHNFLRNNGAGYGMNALKIFNILYGLKKIEENELLDKCELSDECKFSNLLKLANENKDEKLAELIYGSVLDSISESKIRDLLFYEIPKNIKSSTLTYLIKQIDKITQIENKCNVLLSGKIYEYFIGRDESAISELGAYFTDRHIVNYIYNKLKPTIDDDNKIKTMIDMFGGSGGFTTGYINYMKTNYDSINWETELSKIFHFDMNDDVIKSAGLEFFCSTGVMPDMKNNLHCKNSFMDEFNRKKFDYIITNPPYGGDKNEKTDTQIKRTKIKEFIKKDLETLKDKDKIKFRMEQLKLIEKIDKQEKIDSDKLKVSLETSSNRINKFAKKHNLKGNDKESVSLMLMMDMLEVGGTCIGVLKEGVFFNKTYKDVRKCLIENFNVREVVSVPSDQFENTSTKTSIVIFDNSEEKTTEVKFSELIVEKYTEDKFDEINNYIVLVESKDDIKEVCDNLISTATINELLQNNIYSLNGKDYNKKEIICGKDYKLVKLGDISNINPSNKLTKNNYNYIEISDIENNSIINFTNLNKNDLPANAKNIVEYNNILISSVRPKNTKMILISKTNLDNIDNYVFSSALANIKLHNPLYSYYIYGVLYNLVSNFEKDICNGSQYPRFKPNDLINLQIPIPKSEAKIKEWVDKISKPYEEKNIKQNKIKELENTVMSSIQNIMDNEDCNEVELGNVCEVQDGFEFKLKELTTDNNKVPLIRATYIENKSITNFINENTKYDKFKILYGDIIMSQVGDVGKICKYSEKQFGYNKRNAFRLRGLNFNQKDRKSVV